MSFDREEHEAGIICLAVPILNAQHRPLGALSVTGTTRRTSLETLEALGPRLASAARAIAHDAESWLFPQSNGTPTNRITGGERAHVRSDA